MQTLETETYLCKVIEDIQSSMDKELWDSSETQEAYVQLGWINCLKHYRIEPDRDDMAEIRTYHDCVLEALNNHFYAVDRR